MANKIPRVPVREQDPALRATNFEEVCYGYNLEEARTEASRCLHCRNPRCVAACPVGVQIPDFISRLCEGDVAGAADVIARDSSLPSICGRVCPQETQCESKCIRGIKGEPIALGASFLAPYLTEAVILEMKCVGSILILGLSLNMLGLTKIKVMNYVPAVFLPILLCRFL